MKTNQWTFQHTQWRTMTRREYQKALETIARVIDSYGYECFGISADYETIDIWGYEQTGTKRRRRCYLEIYPSNGILEVGTKKGSIVFSHPNYDCEECIEVLIDDMRMPEVNDLVLGIAEVIEPLRKRVK